MDEIQILSKAYRQFLVELGQVFRRIRDNDEYEGFADTFIDLVKSPEVGFTKSEVDNLIKIADMFEMLSVDDLPSHHAMKAMVNKKVDMSLLESAQTLSVTDFKELIKDQELGTQERTYEYEVIKRAKESGSIKRVFGEELQTAMESLSKKLNNQ